MKRLILIVGCAFGIVSCATSDRVEPDELVMYGPGNEEEQCPLLEPGDCRASATCRQEGVCLGAACLQVEITGCMPIDVSGDQAAAGACATLGADGCATRADCLSATSLGGAHTCLPQDRTEDTHIVDDQNRVLVNIVVDARR